MAKREKRPTRLRERRAEDAGTINSRWPAADSDALFDHDATLAFDLSGNVRFCSIGARAMLGRAHEHMLDHHITALIPSLPLRKATPGYNAAFVAFWFGRNRWQRYEALHADDGGISVEVTIEPVTMAGERCFVLSLRTSARTQADLRRSVAAAALVDDRSAQIEAQR